MSDTEPKTEPTIPRHELRNALEMQRDIETGKALREAQKGYFNAKDPDLKQQHLRDSLRLEKQFDAMIRAAEEPDEANLFSEGGG
jgi:hypothetical protein